MLKGLFDLLGTVKRWGSAAGVSAAIAAGGFALRGELLNKAIGKAELPTYSASQQRVIKQTLEQLASFINWDKGFAFPGYYPLSKQCSVVRRTVVERVKLLQELTPERLEENGICVVIQRRWKSTMRDGSEDTIRSNRYWIFIAPRIAQACGIKLAHDDEGAWFEVDDDGADGFAAPPEPPLPTVMPEPPCRPETATAGAAAGISPSAPPPPANRPPEAAASPCRPETEQERAMREAVQEEMQRRPRTAQLIEMAGELVAIALDPPLKKDGTKRPPRTLVQMLAAVRDTALKSFPTSSAAQRWNMLVTFVLADDGRHDAKPERPRIAAGELKRREDADLAERARINAEGAAAARPHLESFLGAFGDRTRALPTNPADLPQKREAFLKGWDPKGEKPP